MTACFSRSVACKVFAFFAALALVANTLFAPVGTVLAPRQAQAADAATLPITLYDFRADNIFFQYDLGAHNGMTLMDERTKLGGLVESTLSADGQPVYKQEAVEYAAEQMVSILTDYTTTPLATLQRPPKRSTSFARS